MMKIALIVAMAVFASAKPSGHGVVVSGPSGVVTDHGAIGPAGHGSWDHGNYGYYGHHGHDVVVGHHAAIIGPAAGHALVVGPVAHGYAHGYDHGYGHGYGHGGVAVVGPHTVPAVIAGPSGKVVADGLYGVGHGHHSYGHHW